VQFVYKTGSTAEDYVVNIYDVIGQSYYNPREGYTVLSILECGTNAASYQLPNGSNTGDIIKWDGSSWVAGTPSANYQGSYMRATIVSDTTGVARSAGEAMIFDGFTSEGSSITYSSTTAALGTGTKFTLAANSTYIITFCTTDRAGNDFNYLYLIHWINGVEIAKQLLCPVPYTGNYVPQPNITFTYKTGQTSEDYYIELDSISGASTFRPRNDGHTQLSITEVGLSVFGGADRIMVESGSEDNQALLWDNSLLQWNAASTSGTDGDTLIELYGTEVLYWDGRVDPTTTSPAISLSGSASYQTGSNYNNTRVVLLINGANQTSYMSFDSGKTGDFNYKFEVYYRILNTNDPADKFWIFGQGTQTNSGNESSTEGLTYKTDYYSGNTHIHKAAIDIYNGSTYDTLQAYTETRMDDVFDNYNKFTMIRYGNKITCKTESHFNGIIRFRVTSSQTLSGQRFGIGGSSGSEWMDLEIKAMRLVTLD